MIKAASTTETSVNFYQTIRRNNPEDSLHLIFCNFLVTFFTLATLTGEAFANFFENT
jgi:hypothetical protein